MFNFITRTNESYSREGVTFVGRPKNVQMSDEDQLVVAPLITTCGINSALHGIVTLYPKIALKDGVIISSKISTRSTKKNDFTVSFTSPNGLRYGRVQKLLLYPADTEENIMCAVVKELKVQPCISLANMHFPPEIHSIKKLICQDYFSVTDEDGTSAVSLENIVSKCFDNGFCICLMVSRSQVLK